MIGVSVQAVALDLPEIQSLDARIVSAEKARAALQKLGRAVLVDDSALEIEALEGFPGALVAWALDAGGPKLLHRMLGPGDAPKAKAVTVLTLATPDGISSFVGETAGHLIAEPRGKNGFGYDPVFVPEGDTRTFAEMSCQEKDQVSPRALALAKLATALASRKG